MSRSPENIENKDDNNTSEQSFENFSSVIDVGAHASPQEKLDSKKSDDVLSGKQEKNSENREDTISGSAGDTEKWNPIGILNGFVAQKREIERLLSSKDLDKKEESKLLAERDALTVSIIKQGCQILGIEQKEEDRHIAEEQEKEWERATEAFAFGRKGNYEAYQRERFVEKDLPKRYEEQIRGNENLTDKQKDTLLDSEKGEIKIGGLRGIVLSKKDVAVCSYFGWEIDKIKFSGFLGLSDKVLVQGREGAKQFDNLEQFNEFIDFLKGKFIDEGVKERTEQKKQEIIEKSIRPIVLEREIKEIADAIREKQDKEETERQVKREEVDLARVEETENVSEEEKPEKIKQAAKAWKKTYEIDKDLRGGNLKGEAKKQAKKDKNALSKELMTLAQEISGRNFLKDARDIKPKWGKRDLNKYITEQVQLTLEKEGIKFIKDKPESESNPSDEVFDELYKHLNDAENKNLIELIRMEAREISSVRALNKSLEEGAPIGFKGAKIADKLNKLVKKLPKNLREKVIELLREEKRREKRKK